MKNASIDFGNTRIKIGIFENDTFLSLYRVSTINEVNQFLLKYQVENAIVSSVTLSSDQIKSELLGLNNLVFLSHTTAIPLKNKYATPMTLGYDRVAAAVGAHERFPNQNCLIIDMGTAIKYDFLSQEGAFEGGIISPGRRMRFRALHTFTSKLPLLDSEIIPDLIGNSTESCMKSGVMNGIVSEVNGMIEQFLKKIKLKVIITGGDAGYFESQIKYPTFVSPHLVLEGLNRILTYNVE